MTDAALPADVKSRPDASAKSSGVGEARSAARALALQLLYAFEQNRYVDDGWLLPSADAGEVRDATIESFARELLASFIANRAPVDAAIDQRLERWTIHRLTVVDRNILRLGALEVLYRDSTPVRVAINEAIELAKAYGSEDKTTKLVNGVLDRLARDHRPESMKKRPPKTP